MTGRTYYVDFEKIRKHGGYVYFWEMSNYLKPRHGDLSAIMYKQGDCKLIRVKYVSASFHKEPMGEGTGEILNVPDKDREWIYPPPNSSEEYVLKTVCEYAN